MFEWELFRLLEGVEVWIEWVVEPCVKLFRVARARALEWMEEWGLCRVGDDWLEYYTWRVMILSSASSGSESDIVVIRIQAYAIRTGVVHGLRAPARASDDREQRHRFTPICRCEHGRALA